MRSKQIGAMAAPYQGSVGEAACRTEKFLEKNTLWPAGILLPTAKVMPQSSSIIGRNSWDADGYNNTWDISGISIVILRIFVDMILNGFKLRQFATNRLPICFDVSPVMFLADQLDGLYGLLFRLLPCLVQHLG